MKRTKSPQPAKSFIAPGVSTALHLFALTLLTVVVYANSLNGEFVFDDSQIILQNPLLLSIHSLNDVVNVGFGWRQLLFFTYGLNYYWNGVQPYGYHVFNLVLHLINVFLVYLIVFEVAGRTRTSQNPALAGAAVFAVHPLMSSAVSYIAGRSSVLCAVFYFLATLFFLRALNDENRASTRSVYIVLAILSGLFAWQAKQEAITIPVFLAALLWLRKEKRNVRYVAILAALPLVLAATMWRQLSSLFSTVMGNKILVSAGFDTVLPPGAYFRTYATSIVGYYFPRLVFATELNADPYIPPVSHWYSPEFVVSVLVLGAVVWLIARRGTSDALVTAGLSAIIVSPLMAYSLVPLADVVLEHRAYIPGLGVALLAAALFRWGARNSTVAVAVAVLVVVVLSAMTVQRNTVFANEIALWEDTVKKSPEKARSHYSLGTAYQLKGLVNEAIHEYEAAITLKPDLHAAYSNIAAMHIDSGRLDQAEKTLLKLTRTAPDYADGFVNLSAFYLRKRDPASAVVVADRALAINAQSYAANFNKAEALTMQGRFSDALTSYITAASLRPDLASLQVSVAQAIIRSGGDEEQAIGQLKKALQLKPDEASAHHELGIIYLKKQMLDQAIAELQMTVKNQPGFGPAILNLSFAYQTKGDISAARGVLEGYLAQFGKSGDTYVSQVQTRLATLGKP